jgi:hypothetical protein
MARVMFVQWSCASVGEWPAQVSTHSPPNGTLSTVGIVIDRATVSEFEPGKFSAECPVCAERVPINLADPARPYHRTEGRASITPHPGTAPTPYIGVDNRRSGLCAASGQVFTIGEPEPLAEVPQELIDEGFLPN